MLLAKIESACVQRLLNGRELLQDGVRQSILRYRCLLAVIAAREDNLTLVQILRTDFDSERDAALFPFIELPSRTVLFSIVDLQSDAGVLEVCCELVHRLHHPLSFFRFTGNRDDDYLYRREFRR